MSELLISLAILGLIATFTIPKVILSSQNQAQLASAKENIASVTAALYTGYQQGSVDYNTFFTYLLSKFVVVKACDTDAVSQGCWPSSYTIANSAAANPGYVLHGGATLSLGWNHAATETRNFTYDINGETDPNTEGDDQMVLAISFTDTGMSWYAPRGKGLIQPSYSRVLSSSLYTSVMSR